MKLRRYLFESGIKIKHLAKLLDYSPTTISMISLGRQKAGRKIARLIEKHTNGAVTAEEVISESDAKIKKKDGEQLLLFK